ncbi:hypothetical protein [Vampirovibrio sp.]|uniref:hypothetical protein n=1 Tax=Vampirovibrio sp. TaxID=2717857 RepID=UPI0035940A9D
MNINSSNQAFVAKQGIRFGAGENFEYDFAEQRNTATTKSRKAKNLLDEAVIQKDDSLTFVHKTAKNTDKKIDKLKQAKQFIEQKKELFFGFIADLRDQITNNENKEREQARKKEENERLVGIANTLMEEHEMRGNADKVNKLRNEKLPDYQSQISDAKKQLEGLQDLNAYQQECITTIRQRVTTLNSFINDLEIESNALRNGKVMERASRSVEPIRQVLNIKRESFDTIMEQNRRNLENFNFGQRSVDEELENEIRAARSRQRRG